MALNGLFCADVPLRNYSVTHSVGLLMEGWPLARDFVNRDQRDNHYTKQSPHRHKRNNKEELLAEKRGFLSHSSIKA